MSDARPCAARGSLRAASALMARVLRGGAELEAEYPLVFRPGAPGSVLAIEERGRALSACTLLERELVCGPRRLRVGMLGSVATDPEARGRGLASALLDAGVAELAGRGAPLVLLWADEPGFYLRRGWTEVGAELDLSLTRAELEALPEPRGRARPAGPADARALLALLARRPERVERDERELAWMLATPRMRGLVLEREGRIVAWAALGRGADFRDVVHDHAGAAADVLALARALGRELEGERLSLVAPLSAAETLVPLLPEGALAGIGLLALARLGDRRAALAVVERQLAGCRARPEGQRFLLQGPRGALVVDEPALLRLLLPPRGALDEHERLAAATGLSAELLALDAFVGGLDSI